MKNTLKATLFAVAALAVINVNAQKLYKARKSSSKAQNKIAPPITKNQKNTSASINKAPEKTTTTTKKAVKRGRPGGKGGLKSLR
jgi:hypothetical protein